MDKGIIITIALTILGTMFNVYAVNVLTGYKNKPDYYWPSYNSLEISVEERQIDSIKRAKNKELIEKYDYNRNIGLLVIGVLMIILSLVIKNPYIRNGLGIAGLLTILYGTTCNWYRYNDNLKLGIVTASIVIVGFMAMRIYNGQPILPDNMTIV